MPEAISTPTPTCPVAEIGAELRRLIAAASRMEKAGSNLTGKPALDLGDQREIVTDRRHALEEDASWTVAASWPGAMVQLLVLHIELDLLRDAAASGEDLYAGEVKRRIDRLAYSILRFMEQETRLNRDDFGGSFYMPRESDPHTRLEQALAG